MSVHDDMQKIANGTPVQVCGDDGEWVDGVYIGLDWQMYGYPNMRPYEGHVVMTSTNGFTTSYAMYDDNDVRIAIAPNHSPLDDYTTAELLAEVGRRCQ